MKLAEQIVSQLQAAGVRRIYGIVGDSLNPIVDAVRRTRSAERVCVAEALLLARLGRLPTGPRGSD